jgi:hypothetical protein
MLKSPLVSLLLASQAMGFQKFHWKQNKRKVDKNVNCPLDHPSTLREIRWILYGMLFPSIGFNELRAGRA